MHGESDGLAGVGDGAGDCLPDPPGGIGVEFKLAGEVEFFSCLD